MVSLDTMCLLWGLKKVATAGQEDMIERAENYLLHLRDSGSKALISTPVVAEYLVGFDAEQRKDQWRILHRDFIIVPFDMHAADIAAEILHNKPLVNDLKSDFRVSRQVLKADAAIMACAIAVGASKLISENKAHMTPLAQGKIIVSEIPASLDLPDPKPVSDAEQLDIFDEHDDEE